MTDCQRKLPQVAGETNMPSQQRSRTTNAKNTPRVPFTDPVPVNDKDLGYTWSWETSVASKAAALKLPLPPEQSVLHCLPPSTPPHCQEYRQDGGPEVATSEPRVTLRREAMTESLPRSLALMTSAVTCEINHLVMSLLLHALC